MRSSIDVIDNRHLANVSQDLSVGHRSWLHSPILLLYFRCNSSHNTIDTFFIFHDLWELVDGHEGLGKVTPLK